MHLGEVFRDGQVMISSVTHAAVAARPEVVAAHAQHAPAFTLALAQVVAVLASLPDLAAVVQVSCMVQTKAALLCAEAHRPDKGTQSCFK